MDAKTSSNVFPYNYVILKVFYLLVLTITCKFSVHFHPRFTLGIIWMIL
nr:MAG TPA: hypothetical protein [Caudoviricetes sp.]